MNDKELMNYINEVHEELRNLPLFCVRYPSDMKGNIERSKAILEFKKDVKKYFSGLVVYEILYDDYTYTIKIMPERPIHTIELNLSSYEE